MSLIEINISNLTKKYKRNYVFKNYNNKINKNSFFIVHLHKLIILYYIK